MKSVAALAVLSLLAAPTLAGGGFGRGHSAGRGFGSGIGDGVYGGGGFGGVGGGIGGVGGGVGGFGHPPPPPSPHYPPPPGPNTPTALLDQNSRDLIPFVTSPGSPAIVSRPKSKLQVLLNLQALQGRAVVTYTRSALPVAVTSASDSSQHDSESVFPRSALPVAVTSASDSSQHDSESVFPSYESKDVEKMDRVRDGDVDEEVKDADVDGVIVDQSSLGTNRGPSSRITSTDRQDTRRNYNNRTVAVIHSLPSTENHSPASLSPNILSSSALFRSLLSARRNRSQEGIRINLIGIKGLPSTSEGPQGTTEEDFSATMEAPRYPVLNDDKSQNSSGLNASVDGKTKDIGEPARRESNEILHYNQSRVSLTLFLHPPSPSSSSSSSTAATPSQPPPLPPPPPPAPCTAALDVHDGRENGKCETDFEFGGDNSDTEGGDEGDAFSDSVLSEVSTITRDPRHSVPFSFDNNTKGMDGEKEDVENDGDPRGSGAEVAVSKSGAEADINLACAEFACRCAPPPLPPRPPPVPPPLPGIKSLSSLASLLPSPNLISFEEWREHTLSMKCY